MLDEHLYLWFGMMSSMDYTTKMNIVVHCGGIRELWKISERALRDEFTERQADHVLEFRSESTVLTYEKRLRSSGFGYVYPGHEFYPERLYDIPDPPMVLFVRGNIQALGGRVPAIAVVGARKASLYGRNMADRISGELAAAGVIIVSGMALGIDGAAHRAAIAAGGTSIAVLGSGINVPYPRENYNIYYDIQKAGVVISESGLDVKPEAFRFPYRNRIISGMTDGVLVVEAREKSGSLITSDQALEQGRDVYAIPGRVTDFGSLGCNNLIKQGAVCVTDSKDILDMLGIGGQCRQENHLTNQGDVTFNKNLLASNEKKVYSCVRLESKHVDDICFEADVTVSEAAQILYGLEQKGLVKQLVRNYYVRA